MIIKYIYIKTNFLTERAVHNVKSIVRTRQNQKFIIKISIPIVYTRNIVKLLKKKVEK